ncbi:hypothetical protein HBN50_00195 [Halobacteriovorax sp. GB3]|uniref:hypothetical protein n=1 Tax=Halobacteriovorax sp. GB3 TaxID=2719615 RepID=UPI00235F67C5|nr:hypothetical protein [Halobacteriovorax sp. GB3]MDD0851486.1 hypothetical protein [Halobacteriovorax sp. GB3]
MRHLFKKSLLAMALCSALTTQTLAASKVLDYLLSASGVEEVLYKKGFDPQAAQMQAKNIVVSLKNLSPDENRLPTLQELESAIEQIPDAADKAEAKKILAVLNQDADKVSKDQLVDSFTQFTYIADRHSLRSINRIACTACGEGATIIEVSNKTVNDSINRMKKRFKTDKQLESYIKKSMRKMKLGKYSSKEIDKGDLLALATHIDLMANGSSEMKTVMSSLKRASYSKNGTDLLGAGHNFATKLLLEEQNPEQLLEWAARFDRVTALRKSDNTSFEEAFKKTLREDIDKAQGSRKEAMQKAYDDMEVENCFFK